MRCERVGKAYQFYRKPLHLLLQVLIGGRRHWYEEFWALRDIGFAIRPGEAVGIVGRNGSGKTTLLQLLCGITRPSAGTLEVRGRIAPVLALGAAFDYELTGRENAYLSGAILGLSRRRMDERIGAIHELCGLGDFFERPIRLYSSGMSARLAFAVCAHAEGDLLIVDEALSVGDEGFRQRCEALIGQFRQRGTLIFVSHDTTQVARLCERVLWIDRGTLRADGPPGLVLDRYHRALAEEPDDPNRFAFMA